MSPSDVRRWCTPRERDLGLRRIANNAGLGISVLPNGSVFAIAHQSNSSPILVNQVLASSIDGGIGVGLWRYMPYYRVGEACVWDLAVALLTIVGLWRLSWWREERRV
jgi:hypothetical protein